MQVQPSEPKLVPKANSRPSKRRGQTHVHRVPSPSAMPVPATLPAKPSAAVYRAFLLSGLAIGVAWLVTETASCAILGWISAVSLVAALRMGRFYLPAYCCGLVVHAVGFYWILGTVARFGGFGWAFSALVFAAYVASGALMYVLVALIHHHLGPGFEALALRTPTAVVLTELVMVRLFAWHYGHTQTAFVPLVQVAGIGGAMAVTFLMFWVAEAAWRALVERERRWVLLLPAIALLAALGYGCAMMNTFAAPHGDSLDVLLIQGDPALVEKPDVELAWRNVRAIYQQSHKLSHANTLIVWPESSIPAFVPGDIGSARKEPGLPWLGNGSAFLIGGYSFRTEEERYNAAFAVYPDGTVPLPYAKQILIPFGEYMPASSIFPWLNGLHKNFGLLRAGTESTVFEYPLEHRDGSRFPVRVSPLICYEDTVPALARDATRRGAQVLVNLTHDAWFGRTACPYQHHLIAVFRAIENRRFLVRATSTGYSAVVDPLGRTVAHLPLYKESNAHVRVTPLNYQSTYTQYFGDKPWWAYLVFTVGTVAVARLRRGRPARTIGSH
jgi:apolipoprotein N-acyltransferase